MKNNIKKYVCVIATIFIVFPNIVFAQTCNQKQLNKINTLINNIKFDFIHDHDNIFNLKIYNIPPEIKILDDTKLLEYTYNVNNLSESSNYIGGLSYSFTFSVTDAVECETDVKFRKNIYVNKYNLYSEREICSNIEYKDFKLCNKNYQGKITDEIFDKELKKYISNKKSNKDEINSDNKNIEKTNRNIYLFIIPSILIIMIILFVFKLKKGRIKNEKF